MLLTWKTNPEPRAAQSGASQCSQEAAGDGQSRPRNSSSTPRRGRTALTSHAVAPASTCAAHLLRALAGTASMFRTLGGEHGRPFRLRWPRAASSAAISRSDLCPAFVLRRSAFASATTSGRSSRWPGRPPHFSPAAILRSRALLSFATSRAFSYSEKAPATWRSILRARIAAVCEVVAVRGRGRARRA